MIIDGKIENSFAQLNELDDSRLNDILSSDIHGHNNKRLARDILTDRRLNRLENESEAHRVFNNLLHWINKSDSALRLACGELTAQEIRTVRAVLSAIYREEG